MPWGFEEHHYAESPTAAPWRHAEDAVVINEYLSFMAPGCGVQQEVMKGDLHGDIIEMH